MAAPELKFVSQEEYLEAERLALDKHEYYRGEIFAMSGASFEHNQIESNLLGPILHFLKGRLCKSFGSNLRVHIPENTLYTYPDIIIICDEPKFVDDTFDTITNPSVIIEILSPSTEAYDRGAKFDLYRDIETLNEYILVSSTSMLVISYTKNTSDNSWVFKDFTKPVDILNISTIQYSIALADIYADVDFNRKKKSAT